MNTFSSDVAELYQGEVFGEAFFSEMLLQCSSNEERWKTNWLLQLETETKIGLRPIMVALGISIAENHEIQIQARALARARKNAKWLDVMSEMAGEIHDRILPRYRAIAANARVRSRSCDVELAMMMVRHEEALLEFTQRELDGRSASSIEPIIALVVHRFES